MLRVKCREGLRPSRTLVLLGAVASSSTAVRIRCRSPRPAHTRLRPLDSGCAAMASADRVGSWIRRLSHHRVVSGKRSDAQTHPTRTHRRAWKLRCTRQPPRRGARYGARCNGISVTALAEAVGSWIRRMYHHCVVSEKRSDAQTHPTRTHRCAWKLRCTRRPSAVGRSVWRSK